MQITCPRCGESKDNALDFYQGASYRLGRSPRCKTCDRARALVYHHHPANHDRRLAQQRAWAESHKDENTARWAAYRQDHPETKRASQSRRRQRSAQDMTAEDRDLSRSYRQAIQKDPCAYCGKPADTEDHVLPLAKGGTDHWWNLVRACRSCNSSKGTKTA